MWQRGDGMQRTNIYLDEDQLRLLKDLAAAESKSVADLVRQAVDQFLRSRLEDGVTWQNDMTALIEQVHSRVSPAIDPDEIERDIREARQDVRAAQR
jgi:DNA-binding ferritin-like protein (Dps family)